MTLAATDRAAEVVTADLAVMGDDLDEVFSAMSGERLLITGGAGFLGYYMVQAPLAWNAANPDRAPISVTVFDNYFRGVPGWLGELEGRDGLELRNHDMRLPLPEDMGDFEWVVPCRRRRVPHLLPGAPHRDAWTPTSMGCATCSTTP